jgi:hypothetical protein
LWVKRSENRERIACSDTKCNGYDWKEKRAIKTEKIGEDEDSSLAEGTLRGPISLENQ